MNPLRFALVTTFYPPYNTHKDGLDVQRWARALVGQGHSVDVIHDTDAYRLLTGHVPDVTDENDGVGIHRLRSPSKFLSSLGVQQLGRPTTHRDRLSELLNGRYDVIHYHNISLIGGPGLWKIGTGIKIHTVHDYWLACPSHSLWRHDNKRCDKKACFRCVIKQGRPPQLWRITGTISKLARHVDVFMASSQSAIDLHRQFGFNHPMELAPPISTVNAPPLTRVVAAAVAERPYFFFDGALDGIQGLHDVIPIFAENAKAEFLIAGIGTDEVQFRRLASHSKNIRFLARQSEENIRRLRKGALAIVVPNLGYEVFPNSILEAFREGKPVIARDVGPNRDVIERSGGGFVFSCVSELEKQIHNLANDRNLVGKLGRFGFNYFAQNWREDVAISSYLKVIRNAAEKRGLSDLVRKTEEPDTSVSGSVMRL